MPTLCLVVQASQVSTSTKFTWASASTHQGMTDEEAAAQEHYECCYQQLREWPYLTENEIQQQAALMQRSMEHVAAWFQWRQDHDINRRLHWPTLLGQVCVGVRYPFQLASMTPASRESTGSGKACFRFHHGRFDRRA